MPLDSESLGPYPGRGLIHLVDASRSVWWLYFITGRSDASRARRVRSEANDIFVESTAPDADADPLRYYACLRPIDGGVVVGNGDHVDVLARRLRNEEALETIVESIDPEPDPPIFTPRIALVLDDRSRSVAVYRENDQVVRRIEPIGCVPHTATLLTTYSGPVASPCGNAPTHSGAEERSVTDLARSVFHEALPTDLAVLLIAGPANPGSASTESWLISHPGIDNPLQPEYRS